MLIAHKPRAVNVGLLQIQIFNVLDGINIGDYDIPVTIVEYNLASIGFSWKQESHRLHRSLRIDMIGDIRGTRSVPSHIWEFGLVQSGMGVEIVCHSIKIGTWSPVKFATWAILVDFNQLLLDNLFLFVTIDKIPDVLTRSSLLGLFVELLFYFL